MPNRICQFAKCDNPATKKLNGINYCSYHYTIKKAVVRKRKK